MLIDLSKAFDCITHDLLNAKLAMYGFNDAALRYVYSYLSNRKQCVSINNTYSNYYKIISGVPQGSTIGPIMFKLLINNSFFFVSNVSLHNFSMTSYFLLLPKEFQTDILQSGPVIAIDCFKNNKMIVYPDKFQVILLDKSKSDHTNQRIVVDNQNKKVVLSVELLGIQINDKFNFNLHISNICRSAAKRILGFKEKKILINNYFMVNFD